MWFLADLLGEDDIFSMEEDNPLQLCKFVLAQFVLTHADTLDTRLLILVVCTICGRLCICKNGLVEVFILDQVMYHNATNQMCGQTRTGLTRLGTCIHG